MAIVPDPEFTRPNDTWFSNRGIPLITQPNTLPIMTEMVLSVERYEKWYELYICTPGVTFPNVRVVDHQCPTYSPDDMWRDHCIVPTALVQFAKSINAKMDLQTYDAVCRRYIQDWIGRNTVFTREFCKDIFDWKMGFIGGDCFEMDRYPSSEDLQSVLINHDIELII